MQNKQKFDSIKFRRIVVPKGLKQPVKQVQKIFVPIDGIRKVHKAVPVAVKRVVEIPEFAFPNYNPFVKRFRVGVKFNKMAMAGMVCLALTFAAGMWYEANTPKIAAQDVSLPIAVDAPSSGQQDAITAADDKFFSTPMLELKDYLVTSSQQEILDARKAKLHDLLKRWDSPLEPHADLIAEQDHWKLILAISFAESTLGKNCVSNNCSGIGGSNIRSYKTLDNWILGFNRLLERKYNNSSLEQMCGVYVQPCNPRWLLATKQILTAIDKEDIE